MVAVRIFYLCRDLATIRKIQERFNFPKKMTVNWWWDVEVKMEDWDLLMETKKRGFIGVKRI